VPWFVRWHLRRLILPNSISAGHPQSQNRSMLLSLAQSVAGTRSAHNAPAPGLAGLQAGLPDAQTQLHAAGSDGEGSIGEGWAVRRVGVERRGC
jgi:hypothetical protein